MGIINLTLVYDLEKIRNSEDIQEALDMSIKEVFSTVSLMSKRRDKAIQQSREEGKTELMFNSVEDFFLAYEANELSPKDILFHAVTGYSMKEKMKFVEAEAWSLGFDSGRGSAKIPDFMIPVLKEVIRKKITGGAALRGDRIETDEFKAEAEQALRELGLTDTNEEDRT